MFSSTLPAVSLVLTALSIGVKAVGVQPGQIQNLVTFGDSYTDVVNVGDGGTAWPVYATRYSNTTLYPFAKSGATCSNNLTYRPFPSLFESQLPTYYGQSSNGSVTLDADATLYTLWIGTNDLGVSALITGSDPGVSIVDVSECMVNWVQALYDHGARNFLFQNMIPLELLPQYSPDSYPTKFWNFEKNSTEWSVLMTELVLSGNKLTQLMLQDLVPQLADAHVGIFNSHSLFQDMYDHPADYLNGTAPLNVTGSVHPCVYVVNSQQNTCSMVDGTDRDSYLWYDELHPSEQADRIVAQNIAEVIEGKANNFTTWLS